MELADDIVVSIGGDTIVLRPTLRHAIRLEKRPGSFAQIMREVADGSLTVAIDLIRPHHNSPTLAADLLAEGLDSFKFALVAYVGRCTGICDEDAPAKAGKAKSKVPSVTFAEHLAGLYRLGTGWLGWTPQQTLDSTPAEIREAYKGRMEMLKAIFGSGDGKGAKSDAPLTTDQLTAKFKFLFSARAAAGTKGAE